MYAYSLNDALGVKEIFKYVYFIKLKIEKLFQLLIWQWKNKKKVKYFLVASLKSKIINSKFYAQSIFSE